MRLDKERELTEKEMERLEQEYEASDSNQNLKTTAAPDAPIEEVKAGVDEVELAKQSVAAAEAVTASEAGPERSS